MALVQTIQSNKGKTASTIGAVALAIIGSIFAVEKGYVNNPKDPGGETNMGITKNVAIAHDYTGPMKDLTKDIAQDIYYQDYMVKPGYVPFIEMQPALGHKLTDAGVNVGPARSSRWLQTSLNALNRGGQDYSTIGVDGKVGPGTVNAYKSLERVRGKKKACELVIKLLDVQQGTHYLSLTNLNTFTVGWVDHRIGNVPLSQCSD